MDKESAAAASDRRYPSHKIRSIAMGSPHRLHVMAESTGIEPVRPEGLDALAPRCLTARPTLQFKWCARLDSNQHRAV